MHVRETHGTAPAGQRLPLFILISRQGRVVVFEGTPEYDDLKLLLQDLLSLEGVGSSPAK